MRPVAQRAYQCGPAALASVLRYWGDPAEPEGIGRALQTPGARGILNVALARYAREQGYWTEFRPVTFEELQGWVRRGIPPIVMVQVGPAPLPLYHFVVITGFSDSAQLLYANVGATEPRAIRYPVFRTRWRRAGHWTLILCRPGRVDWPLALGQAADVARLAEQRGRLDVAARWYQTALQEEPASRPVRFNLANVYLHTRRWDQAAPLYRQLLAEQPGWGPYTNNLAWIALQRGRPREAIRLIEAALAQGAARRYDILDTLGLAYCRLKRPAQARACLLEALGQVPDGEGGARRQIQQHLAACSGADPLPVLADLRLR